MKTDCDLWQDKLDAFVDDELSSDEAQAYEAHLHACAACAAEASARKRLKIETRAAAESRYEPSEELRARIEGKLGKPVSSRWWRWPALAGATAALVLAVFMGQTWDREQTRNTLLAQLVDQHVASMAAREPVDVVSADAHTVTPWFAGKVPFSVDIPNLENTPYALLGGKLTYFQQEPTAQLVFAVRKHKISVFMFRDRERTPALGEQAAPTKRMGFQVQTWSEDGLRYVAISDVNAEDVRKLCEMLKAAS